MREVMDMTVKQRLTRSNVYMFLVPLLIAAMLLILGAGIALYFLETKHLPRLGRSLYEMHNKDVLKGTDKETSKRRLIIMRNNIHNYIAKTAIDYANIQPEEIMDICFRQEGTLVEVDFNTEWMNYICYVDLSGEALDFLSEPVPIHDTDTMVQFIQDRRCA